MVDMGVRQDQSVDGARIEWKGAIVEFLLAFRALEHAAIDQHAMPAGFDQVAGACDGFSGTVKGDDRLVGHRNTSG